MHQVILEEMMVFAGLMATLGCLTGIIITMLKRRRLPPPVDTSSIDARLAQIEQIVETTAVEVERVAEAQRFVAKLLAERGTAQQQPLRPAERATTPH